MWESECHKLAITHKNGDDLGMVWAATDRPCLPRKGLVSDVAALLCNDSAFVPSTFSCGTACAPPDGGPLVP